MRPENNYYGNHKPSKREYILGSITASIIGLTSMIGSHDNSSSRKASIFNSQSSDAHLVEDLTVDASSIKPLDLIGPLQDVNPNILQIELKVNEELRVGMESAGSQVMQNLKKEVVPTKNMAVSSAGVFAAQSLPISGSPVPLESPFESQPPTPIENKPSQKDDTEIWDKIAHCESTDNWAIDTDNGYLGGLQEDVQFWTTYGGLEFAPSPNLATKEKQILIAERARDGYNGYPPRGYTPWPTCARKAGLIND